MKRLISFDSYEATSYDVVAAVSHYRQMPGVRSVEVLTALDPGPAYLVVIDVEDDQAEAIADRLESTRRMYAGYTSNYSSRAYRVVTT